MYLTAYAEKICRDAGIIDIHMSFHEETDECDELNDYAEELEE
jgi:hypothetical protein